MESRKIGVGDWQLHNFQDITIHRNYDPIWVLTFLQ